MAQAEIILADDALTDVLVDLYNQCFRPSVKADFFQRRFLGRHNILRLVAQVDRQPVGFKVGFELKPAVFFTWICGVDPAFRRQGVARQLHEAQVAWCREHAYESLRMECSQANKAQCHFAIAAGYRITGVRWDHQRHDLMALWELQLDTDAGLETYDETPPDDTPRT